MDTLTLTLVFFALIGIGAALYFHLSEKKHLKHP